MTQTITLADGRQMTLPRIPELKSLEVKPAPQPGAVTPRPTISPVALTTTQPTDGLGQVVPRPRRASASACAIWDSSLSIMCCVSCR